MSYGPQHITRKRVTKCNCFPPLAFLSTTKQNAQLQTFPSKEITYLTEDDKLKMASELESIQIFTKNLAIATTLYPNVLHPRCLTFSHIAAIRMNADPSSRTRPRYSVAVALTLEADTSIRRALVYDKYQYSFTPEQFAARNTIEDFAALGLDIGNAKDHKNYFEDVGTWRFMVELEEGGVEAQKNLLEEGWTAFMQVPDVLKQEVGLLDDGEKLAKGAKE